MLRRETDMMSNSPSQPALNRKLLGSGVLLLSVGGALWLTGAVLSAAALAQAAKKWIAHFDKSPSEMAHRRIQQLRGVASAGSMARPEQSH